MNVTVIGYGLQFLLLIVLIVALCYKSWPLLASVLGVAVVLLVLACLKMYSQNNVSGKSMLNTTNTQNTQNAQNIQHPYSPYLPYPHRIQLTQTANLNHVQNSMGVLQNTIPGVMYSPYNTPYGYAHPQREPYTPIPNVSKTSMSNIPHPRHTDLPLAERMAQRLNSYADRPQVMQTPHRARNNMNATFGNDQGELERVSRYLVPIKDDEDHGPHKSIYALPGEDMNDPQNPMNSLSYLSGRH